MGYSAAAVAAAKLLQLCPTLRPHRLQPTRLLHPWDSPGKNTGVGFHFLLQCMKVESQSEVAQLRLTLSDPMDCSGRVYRNPITREKSARLKRKDIGPLEQAQTAFLGSLASLGIPSTTLTHLPHPNAHTCSTVAGSMASMRAAAASYSSSLL